MISNEVVSGTMDDDFSHLTASPSVKVAGGTLMVLGVFTTLLAVQTAMIARLQGIALLAILAHAVLGPSALVLGWNVFRMRGRAALFGTVVAAIILVASASWCVFALWHGLVSLLALALPGLALIAAPVTAISISRLRLADEARARLRAQGLDIGA